MILVRLDSSGNLQVAQGYVCENGQIMTTGGAEPSVGTWARYADISTACAALGVAVPTEPS